MCKQGKGSDIDCGLIARVLVGIFTIGVGLYEQFQYFTHGVNQDYALAVGIFAQTIGLSIFLTLPLELDIKKSLKLLEQQIQNKGVSSTASTPIAVQSTKKLTLTFMDKSILFLTLVAIIAATISIHLQVMGLSSSNQSTGISYEFLFLFLIGVAGLFVVFWL
ncbi:hypothetical protein [Methanoregula sp.]|uniref:hypothetical protein n=1 Tax=Methanoregula sp. TaxID=2052170 RepID=UPI003BB00EF3